MSRLRVGLVSPYDLSTPGGVQAQVLGLARYLNQGGDEAVVIGPGLPEAVQGVDLGASIRVPGNGSMVPISFDPRARRRIRAACAELDLLHVHEPLMPLASLFANHAGPPVVATFHADPGTAGRIAYRLGRPLFTRAMGNAVAITAVSETAASVLPPGTNFEVIANGLDVASLRAEVERDPYAVAFLGRDEPRKGLDVLLEAWPAVLEQVPGARLTVMGSNRGQAEITWMGYVDDATKARVLGSSGVYVAPHLGGESFGIVLVEALAAGAAVVASNLDSFVAVADGAARFVPSGDASALGETLAEVLADPDEQRRLASIGAERAKRFDWSVVGKAYRDLYARVVS
jgi:phosphatidylinositol alpha-mannosyltransferase